MPRPDLPQPSPSPAPSARSPGAGPVLWLTGLGIALILCAAGLLVWSERQQTLQQAEAVALRRVGRLTNDLSQSLALAKRVIELTDTLARQPGSSRETIAHRLLEHSELLSALAIPFELHGLDPAGQRVELADALHHAMLQGKAASQDAGTTRWQAQPPSGTIEKGVLPMDWRPSTPGQGLAGYRAEFSLAALLQRLDSERMPPGGGAALFRLDPDGRVTVLARAPYQMLQMGRPVGGRVADAMHASERGVFATPGELDGIPRRTAFQRLPAPASSLVVAYGFAVDDVLVGWSRRWPWVAGFAALLSLALGWGGWRLARSQTRLAHSEQRLRLALASGQVWEWDLSAGTLDFPARVWLDLGHAMVSSADMVDAFTGAVSPKDLQDLRAHLSRHFRDRTPLATEFRLLDAQGVAHWYEIEGQADWNDQGRAVRVAGTIFETTERHRLEQSQRQLLQHLDTVANASAALAWTVDEQQRREWLNHAWLSFTGRDMATERATPWLDDLHPQDRERCGRVFDEAFAARKAYSLEYRMRRHDGQYRWLHEQGRPRYDADRRFIGYIGSCLDMTELREAEATARDRSATLKQVFDVLQDMLFVVDRERRFIFFLAGSNDRLYRHPEAFLGRSIDEVMPPPLVTRLRAAMERAQNAGLQELDYRLDLPEGTRDFNARLAWLPQGEQCMFLVRDITEQQDTLRERERLSGFVLLLFRLANRFINLPVQQMDPAIQEALGDLGRFVAADRVSLCAYDFDTGTRSNTHEWCAEGVPALREQMQGMPLDAAPGWLAAHQRGEMVSVPDAEALPDGELKDLLRLRGVRSLVTLPLTGADACLGYVCVDSVHDRRSFDAEQINLLQLFTQMLVSVQERGRAQGQLRALTGQLEQKVDERTQQLNESVQRLQAVNRELESFNYSASHDLRTPLRGIEGFSALLLEDYAPQLDARGRDYLQRIQRATLHMSQLVSDLLTYSRLQQVTERHEPVSIDQCARTVLGPFEDEMTARKGSVSLDMPEGLQVRADPQGLAIVLRNLIDNALKFTGAGDAPQIRIQARVQGDRVHLSVSDRGMGFDMQHHDRIFDMFQRLHRQDQIPGTGIGLALVRKAVERMEGHIRAESAPGQGASFHIDLPLA